VEAIAVIRQRRGIGAFLAVVGALAWSIGFAVWAYVGAAGNECIISTAGAERCRSTPLVHGFGRELVLVLTPAIVCLVVWALLRRYCTRGQRTALGAAALLAGLFAAFCYLAGLSIGPLLLPSAGLLLSAVAITQPPAAARRLRRAS
jgi:Na+/H+-dicarboxylate symporter